MDMRDKSMAGYLRCRIVAVALDEMSRRKLSGRSESRRSKLELLLMPMALMMKASCWSGTSVENSKYMRGKEPWYLDQNPKFDTDWVARITRLNK